MYNIRVLILKTKKKEKYYKKILCNSRFVSCSFCTEMMQGGISPAKPINIQRIPFFISFQVKEKKINDTQSLPERIDRLE
jgi:hypothetical protein